MSAWKPDGGRWLHRPWWKVAINTVLRVFLTGPGTTEIYTRCEHNGQREPARVWEAVGYGIGKVMHQ